MEIYKDIKDYEGYQISDTGVVKSKSRTVKHSRGNLNLKERILKLTKNKGGYLNVKLYKNGKGKILQVHQLVAVVFLGHELCGHNQVVRHLDGNPLNNHVDNLAVGSQRENIHDKPIIGTSKFRGVHKGSHSWVAQITIKGKNKYLGSFKDENLAAYAYKNELKNIINGS